MRLWDERCSFSAAGIAGLASVTLTLNWLLLAALNRKRSGTKNVAS
jgi:hypothetical protein